MPDVWMPRHMAMHVLAYNLTRVMNIVGVRPGAVASATRS
jgi:hypothetical protein